MSQCEVNQVIEKDCICEGDQVCSSKTEQKGCCADIDQSLKCEKVCQKHFVTEKCACAADKNAILASANEFCLEKGAFPECGQSSNTNCVCNYELNICGVSQYCGVSQCIDFGQCLQEGSTNCQCGAGFCALPNTCINNVCSCPANQLLVLACQCGDNSCSPNEFCYAQQCYQQCKLENPQTKDCICSQYGQIQLVLQGGACVDLREEALVCRDSQAIKTPCYCQSAENKDGNLGQVCIANKLYDICSYSKTPIQVQCACFDGSSFQTGAVGDTCYDNKLHRKCGYNEYYDDSMKCTACTSKSEACMCKFDVLVSNCISCDGQCSQCREGYYVENGYCMNCMENCSVCTVEACQKCSSGYKLKGEKCVVNDDQKRGLIALAILLSFFLICGISYGIYKLVQRQKKVEYKMIDIPTDRAATQPAVQQND